MHSLNAQELEAWFQTRQNLGGQTTGLSQSGLLPPWNFYPHSPHPLRREDNRFHRAVAVLTTPTNPKSQRAPWSQFMVEMLDTRQYQELPINGIILLARTSFEDKPSYLVQAKAEPGAIHQKNNLFLTTTIQASFSNAEMNPGKIPLWDALAPKLDGGREAAHARVAPSIEDPGIFYGKHNLLVLHDLSPEEAEALKLPETHVWADREAIRYLQLQGQAAQFIADVLGTFE